MRVSVNQPNLAAGLSIVGRGVSSRSTLPVLGNILLEAKGDQLRLAATNREIGINCWIGAKVEDEGAITIPARLLAEFVNSLPPERIDMELAVRTQTMHLSCARFEANMKGIDAFEFPLLQTYQEQTPENEAPTVSGDTYTVDKEALAALIDGVIFAASKDVQRPTLTGVETVFDERKLTLGATDGYRMSTRTIDASFGAKATVIVPARSFGEVARIVKDASGDVTIVVSTNRNQIMFSAPGQKLWQRVDVVSELIDARFPDFRATIPKSHNTRATIDTKALLDAVRVALLFGRDNANIVRFAFAPEAADGYSGKAQLSAASAEMGNNVSELACEVEGDRIDMAFDGRFVIDTLAHIDTPQVIIGMTQPTRPATFRPVDDSEFLQVVMPMNPPR